LFEAVEGGLALGGVALDRGGQFGGGAQVFAGGPDVGSETTQREFGGVEGPPEAEQPEDDKGQSYGHDREDCGAAHRRLMTDDA
jgi:hypothetical protein